MEVLVDTSVWIDYFQSGAKSQKLDFLIDENLVSTNDLILAELIPHLRVRNQKRVISLLNKIKKCVISPDWEEIIEFQVLCLKSGSSGIGISDLIIAQNSIQNNISVYSLDKHFRFISKAKIGIKLFT